MLTVLTIQVRLDRIFVLIFFLTHVCKQMHLCALGGQKGTLCHPPPLLLTPLRQGLFLNLGLKFYWPNWKVAAPSNAPVSVLHQAGVQALGTAAHYLGAGSTFQAS